ncbi:MAG: hypothetical protein KDD82_00950 [Planctomycetes bacterium]|nr:hypothetical protein [Planctomycetota bacterium]
MGDENPYSPPTRPVADLGGPSHAQALEGSFGLGIFLGVFLGLWGWLGCLLLAKPQTKRGALFGFLGRIAAILLLMALLMLTGA